MVKVTLKMKNKGKSSLMLSGELAKELPHFGREKQKQIKNLFLVGKDNNVVVVA